MPEGWTAKPVLVVVAHPDDEVLGCGATLAQLADLRIVHVTDGAPRNGKDAARHGFATSAHYAAARAAEARAALALAGVADERISTLGIADQAGSEDLVGLVRALVPLLDRSGIVLTHAFEGGHSDHDAVAFAVQAASRLCRNGPAIYEMPFYYGDEAGWVRQTFLPDGNHEAFTRVLTPDERALKAAMRAAHASQRDTLCGFSLDVERFRPAPARDFTVRPHAGPLLYERHGWNLDWPTWQSRVSAAVTALEAERP